MGLPNWKTILCVGLPILGPAAAWAQGPCEGGVRAVIPPIRLPIEAPQGIAIDGDGSLWICSIISNEVIHLGADLSPRGGFTAPFPEESGQVVKVSGIACNIEAGTILLVQPVLKEIWEFEKDGTPTDLRIPLEGLEPPPNIIPETFPKGIAFDPLGNGGLGSVWLIEAVMTRVYEVALDGSVLQSFCDPLDPDGCPGKGAASPANDLDLLTGASGAIEGFEILTGEGRRDRIVPLDLAGERAGGAIPMVEVGGRPGGFARGRLDAGDGPRDVIFVTVESSAELHVLEAIGPRILPIDRLEASVVSGSVDLVWTSLDDYERIEVRRDGELLASLPGAARTFADSAPPEGILIYEVKGFAGGCETAGEASAVVGPGEVLHAVDISAVLKEANVIPERVFPCSLAEDGEGNLWISDTEENRLLVFDKDLAFLTAVPSPFQDEEDETTGIAFNPAGDGGFGSFFLYNVRTNLVQEVSAAGEVMGDPFPSGVPSDPEDKAIVTSMLFDPAGASGEGSFWYLDFTRASIEERTRGGAVIRSCVHPDATAEPPPDRSPLDAYAWGMTPAGGIGSGLFDLTGGRVRDLATTRILRLDMATCAETGDEVPIEGMAAAVTPLILGIHRTFHAGREVLYVVHPSASQPFLFEVDADSPAIPRVQGLSCAQESELAEAAHRVRLTFTPSPGLDSIEVLRDGSPLASLPGDAASHVDETAPAGLVRYSVRGVKGAGRGEERECVLRTGPGSIAAREFAYPGTFLHQVTFDPAGGRFIAAANANGFSDDLYVYDRELRFTGTLPSPFRRPRQVAALAARDAAGSPEVFCLGWLPGASPGSQREFPLTVIDAAGRPLRGLTVSPPRPQGGFVSFPSGMAWDGATDTFWYMERNSKAIVNMSAAGRTLAVFPHPAPIHQDGIINFGIAVDGARGVLYVSSAGRLDFGITKLVETTLHGVPTGVEVPLGGGYYSRSQGFSLDAGGTGFVVCSSASNVWDMVRLRAFAAIEPIADLACSPGDGGAVLSWTNGGVYDSIRVLRGLEEAAALSGGETSWRDPTPPPGPGEFYRLVPLKGGVEGPGTVCVPLFPRAFLRGDVDENADINITDAITILNYLFVGGEAPACLDAADVNDDGEIDIADGIGVLGFLFLSAAPPALPFPDLGYDPTPDGMDCTRG